MTKNLPFFTVVLPPSGEAPETRSMWNTGDSLGGVGNKNKIHASGTTCLQQCLIAQRVRVQEHHPSNANTEMGEKTNKSCGKIKICHQLQYGLRGGVGTKKSLKTETRRLIKSFASTLYCVAKSIANWSPNRLAAYH